MNSSAVKRASLKSQTTNMNHATNNNIVAAVQQPVSSSDNKYSSTQHHQACAACKYQRRKCTPDCLLAPYFPQERNKEFMNVHKLFGVSNILKVLKKLDPSSRDEAAKSIIYHANARKADPVNGCYGIILNLKNQIELYQTELDFVMHQLNAVRSSMADQHGCSS